MERCQMDTKSKVESWDFNQRRIKNIDTLYFLNDSCKISDFIYVQVQQSREPSPINYKYDLYYAIEH